MKIYMTAQRDPYRMERYRCASGHRVRVTFEGYQQIQIERITEEGLQPMEDQYRDRD